MSTPARILLVASEAVPFAKSGGLGDVVGALAAALRRLGADTRVVLPFYRAIRQGGFQTWRHSAGLEGLLHGERTGAGLVETWGPGGVPVYLVERDDCFDRPSLYGEGGSAYADNLERFSFFSHAALSVCTAVGFSPHAVHAHDWQTGLALALLDGPLASVPGLEGTRRVFTIHNLAYQGLFPLDALPATGLPPSVLHPGGIEHFGALSLLKAGIVSADAITTVSPTYAREILEPGQGMGMEGTLRYRSGRLQGILNGLDTAVWDPSTDPALPARYHPGDMSGKSACRRALIEALGLDGQVLDRGPLFGMTTRLTEQKGIDLVLGALDALLAMDLGLVVLGTGDPGYEHALVEAARRSPGRLAVRIGFDEDLAHRIAAGADAFLVPSRYEPCGLTQLYALRYGTVPVVRATGGLADSVVHYDPWRDRGTGFTFGPFSTDALLGAVREAAMLYRHRERWERLRLAGMHVDVSWERAARTYLSVYGART
ncbi:MAG: glycogen synthase GlgA [Deltaproteobacteria bacterium]|nr:glycogen synthase GlgA [Deltaproteobacteria bacterium]